MTEQHTLPPLTTGDFTGQPHAYDPVKQPQLFDGVMSKRIIAFFVDAIIILLLTAVAAILVLVFGVITLGLGWLLLPIVFPIVGLGYNALTVGGPNSATVGQRLMGLELRMWFGGKVTPLIAAFHALLFWVSLYTLLGWLVNVLWAVFDPRKRCLHDILAGVVAIKRP